MTDLSEAFMHLKNIPHDNCRYCQAVDTILGRPAKVGRPKRYTPEEIKQHEREYQHRYYLSRHAELRARHTVDYYRRTRASKVPSGD